MYLEGWCCGSPRLLVAGTQMCQHGQQQLYHVCNLHVQRMATASNGIATEHTRYHRTWGKVHVPRPHLAVVLRVAAELRCKAADALLEAPGAHMAHTPLQPPPHPQPTELVASSRRDCMA